MRSRSVATRSALTIALIGVAAAVVLTVTEPQSSAQAHSAQIPNLVAPATTSTTATPATVVTTTTVPSKTLGIQNAQQQLLALGYWLPSADGKVGPLTQQAIYAFQKVEGLPTSGKFDDATLHDLLDAQRATARSTSTNHVEVDKTRQVLIVVKDGKTQWVFNTSTGSGQSYLQNGVKQIANTPNGAFKVTREVNKVDPGPLGPLYRPRYFNGGIAVHGAAEIPPYAASHGCARVSNAAMNFIWSQDMMPIGSSVTVYAG